MRRTNLPIPAALALLAVSAGCDQAPLGPEDQSPAPEFAVEAAEAGAPIAGHMLVTDVVTRPDESVTPGGTTRYRGTVFVVSMFGDVEGDFTYVQTSNWNQYGNGALTGKIEGDASWNGLTGGISASGVVGIHEYELAGSFVLHGSGELAGHKLLVSLEGPLGCQSPCPYAGRVVVPASTD